MDWVLALLGIIATVFVGWWYYRKTLRDPDCRFVIWNSLAFDASPAFDGEVEIKVAGVGEHAPRVSLSHVLIWNAGRGAMRNSDVVSGHEITIRPSESGRILRVRRLAVGREASGLTVRPSRDGSRATVEFHHVNPGDWIAIRLLHSGKGQPSVDGEFVGYSLRHHTPSSWTSTVILIGSAWVCVTMTAFRSAATVVLAEAGINPPVVSLVAPVTGMAISVIGGVSFVVWLLACFYRFLFRRGLPVSLEAVFREDYVPALDWLPNKPLQPTRQDTPRG